MLSLRLHQAKAWLISRVKRLPSSGYGRPQVQHNKKPDALIVAADGYFYTRGDQIIALAARFAVPTIYFQREFVAEGGLINQCEELSPLHWSHLRLKGQLITLK
jgi:hypothetical protein